MFKWKFCYTELSNLLQSTINSPKSNRQPQFTLHHLFEDGVLFFCFDLRVSLCWQQLQNESQQFVSCSHVSFVNFALQPNPTNQIYRSLFWSLEQLQNGNHAELDRCSYERFRTMTDTVTSQHTYLSSWITMYFIYRNRAWSSYFTIFCTLA